MLSLPKLNLFVSLQQIFYGYNSKQPKLKSQRQALPCNFVIDQNKPIQVRTNLTTAPRKAFPIMHRLSPTGTWYKIVQMEVEMGSHLGEFGTNSAQLIVGI